MKRKYLILVCIFVLSLFILPKNVLADGESEEESKGTYCRLCKYRQSDGIIYKKERQFYQKVDIIKKTYGDSIDTTALTYAVLNRYSGVDIAYDREYDEDFDESEYRQRNEILKKEHSSELSDRDGEIIEANEKYDLLTLAAIVMADSNNNGSYSDVCFMDGLTGDRLVRNSSSTVEPTGNGVLDSINTAINNSIRIGLDNIVNAAVCGKTKAEGTDSYAGDSESVKNATEKIRIQNINNVCENGYIGGLWNGVKNISDEEKKEGQKKIIAQQIIDKANYYRKLYGKESEEACVDNSSSVSGSYADWKQTDNRWKDVVIGDESEETLGKYGCLVTSMAIQISRSGSKIGTISSGENSFDPGTFATSLKENGGFDKAANFTGKGYQVIAPNFKIVSDKSVNISDNASLAKTVSSELSSPHDGKYQKFLILRIKYANKGYSSPQHWVAVNDVEGDKVKIYDPAGNGTTLDENYESWTVLGYKIMYATDVEQGKIGTTTSSDCSSGNELNRYVGFIANFEGVTYCNFQGKGEKTGYGVETLPNDPGGATTSFGLTISDKEIADKIGYTSYSQELYSGCTEKKSTEKLLFAAIDFYTNELAKKQADKVGISLNQHELYALSSIDYGGITLAVPIMEAIKTYGKGSEQVFEAFKHSFGNMSYASGLMRKRMSEYELFMTGNYESEAASYLGWEGMYRKASSMSLNEAKSKWPSKRTEYLDGLDFAPINGDSVSSSSSNTSSLSDDETAAKYGSSKEYECIDGKAVKKGEGGDSLAYPICGKKNGTTRILMVGNSRTYIGDIQGKFRQIVKSKGYKANVTEAFAPGQILFNLSAQFNDSISKPYDCVVMQEQTETYLYDYNTFSSGVKSIVNKTKASNNGVMTYIRATWGTNISSQSELNTAYGYAEKIANETGSQIIPDGKAFEKSRAKYPNINLFGDEGSEVKRHQSNDGAYLSAATIFKKLYGESVSDVSYYDSLGKDKAKKLLKIVDEVVPDAKSSNAKGLTGVVECAKKQLGKSYVWATHGPDTFDCSGLTYYCYKTALNVDITPSSANQWSDNEHFTDVSGIEQLVPGDLIVSRGGNHVSIYIGDGQVIHASNSSVGVIQSAASEHVGPIKYKHYKG